MNSQQEEIYILEKKKKRGGGCAAVVTDAEKQQDQLWFHAGKDADLMHFDEGWQVLKNLLGLQNEASAKSMIVTDSIIPNDRAILFSSV